MKRWCFLNASCKGNRKSNDDYIDKLIISSKKLSYRAIVVCDGIGSIPNSGIASKYVSERLIEVISKYFKKRKSFGDLRKSDGDLIIRIIKSIGYISNIENKMYKTTMALSIFTKRRSINIWSGDSRIYYLDEYSKIQVITKDHHDLEGKLLGYFDGAGYSHGCLDLKFKSLPKKFNCIFLTTDGVHENCTESELENFIIYCISKNIKKNSNFENELNYFINNNVSDNYSIALYYSNPSKILSAYINRIKENK